MKDTASLSFLQNNIARKWLIYVLLGIFSGLGAIFLFVMINFFSVYLLNHIAGFPFKFPTNEKSLFTLKNEPFKPLIFLIIITAGGFLSGLILYIFNDKESGVNKIIKYFHHKSTIRPKSAIVKLFASSIALGSGFAGGREGPAAEIGASIGSFLGNVFNLSNKEKRMLMVSGLAAGIGAIFRAPMGAAIFATEVLYKEADFEYEALMASAISSITAYSVFSSLFGWQHMFSVPTMYFYKPLELVSYTVLAVAIAIGAILFIQLFRQVKALANMTDYPIYLKTAVGGFVVGLFGIFLPASAGMGYGLLEAAFTEPKNYFFLLMVGILRMFTTSISVGSKTPVGLFAPLLIIGALLGVGIGSLLKQSGIFVVVNPSSFAVVGMAAFLAACEKTPISSIVLTAEITGGYELIVPALWVVAIAFLLTRKVNLEEAQVNTRVDSLVHADEYKINLLEHIKVEELMETKFLTVSKDKTLKEIYDIFANQKYNEILVLDENNKLYGIVTLHVLKTILNENLLNNFLLAADVANTDLVVVLPQESLYTLLNKIGFKEINTVPVVKSLDSMEVIGIIRRKAILNKIAQGNLNV
ncbi:chloride channel protein [Desulfurella sp.]|uniref:chloride channel protein n=1 Tax=Desulfurella sp. TaxID=1962857 RepID=UPI0025C3AC6C|nr:chloride channel protein [Desulfurella sp.]